MTSPIESAIRKTVTQGVMKLADFNRKHRAEPAVPNPFLSGLNAPMEREVTLDHLVVTGTIPRVAGRPLPAHRPQPDRRRLPPPATTGSPATAWCTGCG